MIIRYIKPHLYLTALILLSLTSCYRSHFATTTRINKNGRETFANRYHFNGKKSLKYKSNKNEIKRADPQLTSCSGSMIILTHQFSGITPVTEIQSENLIASTNKEQIFTAAQDKNAYSRTSQLMFKDRIINPDTTVINNEKPTRQKEALPADNRKTEKYGLSGFILSIPGLVPVVCLPLAILGVIFGSISLRKIKRNPTLFKGKGFAIASIILGVIGILGVLLFIG